MRNPKSLTQTQYERSAADKEVRKIVEQFASDHSRLVASLRRILQNRLPAANELVYEYRSWFVISYSPNNKGYDGILSIRGDEKGIKLFLNNGTTLPDPSKLLKGSGKQTRWIPIVKASDLKRPEVERLIDESIESNQIPFSESGKGVIVIMSGPKK
ncbi:MAG: DUF1801 domain-containing protein [Pyrinomonadaceae bacterium]